MVSKETEEFILRHQKDDIEKLALKIRTATDIPAADIPFAITQISGRQAVENKIPSWHQCDDIAYPKRLSLEQCSSEATARYKATLVAGKTFVDLTGGFGVDCAFISSRFESATYIEKQEELCSIARHNFRVLRLNHIAVRQEEASDYLKKMPLTDVVFIDPARRADSGKKTIAITDCDPDVAPLKRMLLEKSRLLMIKLSPMLDISQALQTFPETTDIHVVSVENECKELLFILKKDICRKPMIHCVNINKEFQSSVFSFCRSEEKKAEIEYTGEIHGYIYEPNTSILKAGAYKTIAIKYQLKKLHPDSHLYTSPERISDFPGRMFRVEGVFSFNKVQLKENLKECKQANISIRNFPSTVHELRKKLQLKEGGDIYLFATTLRNGAKVLIKGTKFSC